MNTQKNVKILYKALLLNCQLIVVNNKRTCKLQVLLK